MGKTDAQIEALQPRAARYLVSDGRGLSLDVLPCEVKSWMYRYRHNGSGAALRGSTRRIQQPMHHRANLHDQRV